MMEVDEESPAEVSGGSLLQQQHLLQPLSPKLQLVADYDKTDGGADDFLEKKDVMAAVAGGDRLEPMDDDSQKGLDEPINCYCGKGRDFSLSELQCGICLRWFHITCITCYVGNCVPFMTNYQFFCKMCNPNGLESFSKKQASFSQMCQTAVANLQAQHPDRRMFSKEREIIPFINKHWESLTSMPRRTKLTWHNTVAKTMLKDTDIFLCEELYHCSDQNFGLINAEISKLGPNYDSLKAALAFAKPGDAKSGTASDIRTRGAKRKAAELQSQTGSKIKRGDLSMTAKLAPHGYPLEHPFNKDGYRYYLAESDPHAPGRQAFDESNEWAAPQLKISDDRFTVTGEKGYSMVRATHSVNKGRWYFEVNLDELPAESATRIGWSQHLGNLQAPCGYDKFSYSWRSRKGTFFHQSRGKHYSEEYGEGDVLGFYIELPWPTDASKLLPTVYKDKPLVKFKNNLYYEEKDYVSETEKNLKVLKNSKIIFFKNGKSQGMVCDDIYEGNYYPTVSLYKNATVTMNFGPEFKFPPEGLEEYKPLSEVTSEAMIEHALADILFHVENESNIPEF
ncbi:set1/Ash2 histone methyltransferase complex subunit ASH2-like isoform X2 [Tubulanus polymorphus]|uniref:set1/Ash2 histone methyltransferase complex subunit ASH2-like isoform X2 n=1 Tax=Tubulanus polymorphus TaxID=672921 RepID=UPI003DA236A4